MAPGGAFVVAWTSRNQDGQGWGVYAQRFDPPGGRPAEFRVNTTTARDQRSPAVAADAAGNFVVAWASQNQDGQGWGVLRPALRRRRRRLGPEFRVNTTTARDQQSPTVAVGPGGDFVVAWASQNQDGQAAACTPRRTDAAGAPQGGEFRVNTTVRDNQTTPSVGMAADGTFVVTWASDDQDGRTSGVYAQR